MVHATGVTATAGVLSHVADSAVSHGHVTPHTSSLPQPRYLHTVDTPRQQPRLPSEQHAQASHLPLFLFADRFNNNHA